MSAVGPVNVPASKKVWAAQRDITEASSDALLSIARHSFSTPSGTSSQAAWLSHSPQLARLLSSEGGPEEGDISSSNQVWQGGKLRALRLLVGIRNIQCKGIFNGACN